MCSNPISNNHAVTNGAATNGAATHGAAANGAATNKAAAVGAAWFAVQTRSRHEKKVNQELIEKGVHSFLPSRMEKHAWSDRQKWVELPLFSSYVFVQFSPDSDSRAHVLSTRGVVRFVGVSGRGTAIPDTQIENLRAIVRERVPLAEHSYLKVGEKVRIRGGVLEGIEGVLVAIHNSMNLVVSVDLIEKSVAIQIDGYEVERL
jgi:transcription antitermination factor NusG